MARLISGSRPKARKEYDCMAFGHINDWSVVDDLDLSEDEMLAYREMEEKAGQIQKGEVYVRQFCEDDDGAGYSWIANSDMHDICINHDLYEK